MTSIANKYFKIGEVFTDKENKIKLQCLLADGINCVDCFYGDNLLCIQSNSPECRYLHREDNKDVIFRIKEK